MRKGKSSIFGALLLSYLRMLRLHGCWFARTQSRLHLAPESCSNSRMAGCTLSWNAACYWVSKPAPSTAWIRTWSCQAVSNIGWIVATLSMFLILFMRRRGWWWGLIPLAYGAAILILTADLWSAMAGFLWFGVIAAGFLLFGRRWWKGLALAIALVILVFVLASQPHIAFGIIFLFIEMGYVGMRLMNKHQTISIGEAVRS